MKSNKIILTGICCFIGLSALACSKSGPYVEVAGKRYTEVDLKKEMPSYYENIRKDYEKQIKKGLQRLGDQKIFEEAAKENGLKNQEEYKQSLREKVKQPSEEELQAVFTDLKGKGQIKAESIEEVRGQLISYLRSQKANTVIQKAKISLKKKYKYDLGPEDRKKVETNGEPTLSPNGKILVAEFSGYECPFCKKVQATTKKLREKYGDKLKWVLKDYPLRTGSIYSHAAGSCVFQQDQNKFWKIFDVMYSPDKDREVLKKENLDKEVKALGIDMEKFDKCTVSPGIRNEILQDHREGQKIGVQGIPHFFINGKAISGAQPYEVFEQLVEEELQ